MLVVRKARERDVITIRDIFTACYGDVYAYAQYYDLHQLKKMVFSDDTLLLVAEDREKKKILGTASVVMQVGAYTDFVGEFGRLAVDPAARGRGVGQALMEGRLERVGEQLHLGIVEPRVVHPFSQKISFKNGFAPVGYCPLRHRFNGRQSVALAARAFGEGLGLRRNHPRVIAEANPIGDLALRNMGLAPDLIVDDQSPAYPGGVATDISALRTEAYSSLLRLERGRVTRREIVGPMRLHYGLFKLRAAHATYLVARENGRVIGAVGLVLDEGERSARIFELVSENDEVIRPLLVEAIERCRHAWGIEYVEVDVTAHAPRMQRTCLEIGFHPVAYVPAMVFDQVERLDVVRMVCLTAPPVWHETDLIEPFQRFADLVTPAFQTTDLPVGLPEALGTLDLFDDLSSEQARTLARLARVEEIPANDSIMGPGQGADRLWVVLDGRAVVTAEAGGRGVGVIEAGGCIGESCLLGGGGGEMAVRSETPARLGVFDAQAVRALLRARPDIGVAVYRNLAASLSAKLHGADRRLIDAG